MGVGHEPRLQPPSFGREGIETLNGLVLLTFLEQMDQFTYDWRTHIVGDHLLEEAPSVYNG